MIAFLSGLAWFVGVIALIAAVVFVLVLPLAIHEDRRARKARREYLSRPVAAPRPAPRVEHVFDQAAYPAPEPVYSLARIRASHSPKDAA